MLGRTPIYAQLPQVYGVLPAATIFMLGYSKVSTLLSKRALFYATALPFFAFYLFFKLVMYPMRESLHPSEATIGALSGLPEGMSYVVNLYRNWTLALFYVVSELYSSVRLCLPAANALTSSPFHSCRRCCYCFSRAADESVLLTLPGTTIVSPLRCFCCLFKGSELDRLFA